MTRAEARAQFNTGTRIALLESDADAADRQNVEVNERLSKLLWALIGLLISVTTACILLAVNLAVKS